MVALVIKLICVTDIINKRLRNPCLTMRNIRYFAYKYHLIDENKELKILNECVCIVDYQMDGSSTNKVTDT